VTRKHEPISEQRLDELLSTLPAPEPSAALRRAVAEIPLRHPQPAHGWLGPAPAWFPFRSFGRAALLAAVVLALGALAGLYGDDEVVASTPDGARDGAPANMDAQPGTDRVDELSDLAVLAFADDLDAELEP
jgi:hypothetical protein